jgi:diguanylate cyclase (GGDEF)-like protein
LSDKFKELGIPEYEITPAVSIAVSGLLAQVEHLNTELTATRGSLENLQSMVDIEGEVTLPNKRAFLSRMNWSIAMLKRYGGKTSAVIFRLNDYEGISRVYGLQAAMRIAKLMAEFIAGNIRDTDYFARLSRDEFGVLMYFAEYEDVVKKAESMVMQMRGMPMRWNNSVINYNVSMGVHLIEASDNPDAALIATSNASFIFEEKKKFEQINFKA